ncbi:MAG: porin family protein [Fulvivirga sp.]
MKKYILITAFSVLIGGFSYGQAKLEIGLKAGANFSKLSTDINDFDIDNSTGYLIGAFTLVKIANIGIQPEVNYSLQGTTFKDFGEEFNQDLYYLNIPAMVKFYLPLGLNLQAGPQFGVLVSAKGDEAIDDGQGNITINNNVDLKDSFKNSDLSIALGAGWDLPFGLKVDARYLIGLNDVNDSSMSSMSQSELKNRTWQLSIGYSIFKLGK